jgi:hypothetical protein
MRRLAILLLVGLAGCGRRELSIGSNDAGVDAATPLPPTWLLGTWRGPLQDFQFASGSSDITLAVMAGDGGTLSAQLLLGDAPLLPPPSDPHSVYPPGFSVYSYAFYSEGFEYTAVPFRFDGIELDFGIKTLELWKAWCEMQTSLRTAGFPDGDVAYSCIGSNPDTAWVNNSLNECAAQIVPDGSVVPIDCGWLILCGSSASIIDPADYGTPGSGGSGVCHCYPSGCTFDSLHATDVPGSGDPDVTFSLRPSGANDLEGTTSGTFGDHAVHLTRVE